MSIEAMKQALEIIKNMRSGYGDDYPTEKERKTITALRQAIEQAEKQEPVAWDGGCVLGHCSCPDGCDRSGCCRANLAPRKEWVGLTELEIAHGLEKANLPAIFSYRAAAKAGINAFKEKNT
jgi:hypothetical protein